MNTLQERRNTGCLKKYDSIPNVAKVASFKNTPLSVNVFVTLATQ
jgi:hypothetical protein